ncbi:hypothetical protein Tco_0247291 [Tanacetum coccineum]
MNRFYLALHGYKSEKAICCSMHKRYIRTPSFRYQWTSCVIPTSSELSLPLLVFLLSTFSSSGKTGVYCCQVDKQWFNLSADLLRKALDITPVDPAHPFKLPPTGDTVIDCVNQLGYPEPVEFVSNIRVNYVYQPWRAILSLINQCLTEQTSGIQTFVSHKASPKDPKKKAVPLLIPYGRFTKMIIYYLGSTSNVHRRPESPRHLLGDDFLLGNLKFIPKGEIDEVFRIAIPKPLITEAIQQSSYYPKYLEMVAKNTKKTPQDSASKQSVHGTKHAPPKKLTPVKPTKPAPIKQTKPPSSKLPKSPKKKPFKITPSRKVRKGKPSLVDEEDEAQQEPEPQGEGDDPTLELAKKLSLDAHQEKGEGEEKVVHESSLTTDSEQTKSGTEATAPKAGSDPGQGHEALAGSNLEPMQEDSGPGKEYVALAGPNPEHMDEDFYATAYPKGSIFNDKPTEDDQEKTNVVDETDSIIPDPSHQTNTSAPPVTTPIINISSPKPSSQVNAPPINTKATTIITTILEITPFIALQLRVVKLEQDMSEHLGTKVDDALLKALEKHTANLIQKYSGLPAPESSNKQESEKNPEDILRIKREQEEQKHVPIYTIKSTNTAALKEFDLKAPLFKTIHENKSANRNPANNRLYHALIEALIEDENAMEKEVADKVKDHKRKHDSDDDEDDDDEGPPAGSNQAQQPPAHTSSAWKITDTRDAPSGSLMPRSEPQSEQSSDDIQIQNEEQDSDSDDNDNAHVLKTIPSNDYPEPENNWANVYVITYQDPEENKLQRKIGDIGSFIKWFCKRTGKKKRNKADLEGPTFNLVKSFYKNSVYLQFQMDECYKLLTDKVDLGNPEGHQILRNVYEPLPLGGPPGQLKAARYLDFGLEELVPSLWVESERDYDISAAYGITHWWVRRKEFYINKYHEPSNRDAVRSHMRILNVICIKTYERYRYNYSREIVLRRADYKEYKISEKDFKNLHPNDFKDLKRVEDLQLGIESYQTKLNLKQPNWDASDFLFKEDYTIVNKPRAIIYRDRDDNKKMMRINKVHKFSDGTLTRIEEKMDFMVKDFKLFKFNKGIENRKWTEDDKRRSEDFIEDHLKMEMEMEIPSVKASANSDIVYFFTSAQDGNTLQDDERLDLADDLMKAQVHNQRQSDSGEEDDEKVNNETCLVAQASSEVCSKSSYFSDENSSLDDLVLDNEYDKLCKMSLKIITKNKRLKATRDSLEKGISILKEKVSTLEKNKEVDLECVKCHMLKIENEKLQEEALKLTKFEKSTHCLNEMLNNQKPSGEKLGLGFNSFEASSSRTKEIKFMKAQKKVSPDGGPINMGDPLNVQAAPKENMGPPPGTTPRSEKSVSFQKSILGPRPKHIIVNNVRFPVASDNEVKQFYKPLSKPMS